MGSCFNELIWDGALTTTELKNKYAEYVRDCVIEHGTDAYSGTFSTLPDLRVEPQTYANRQAAAEYVSEHTNKWGHALAVKFSDVRKEEIKAPTFDGKSRKDAHLYTITLGGNTELDQPRDTYVCRAAMVDFDFATKTNRVRVADQLTPAQKTKLVKIYNEWAARHAAHMQVSAELIALCEQIKKVRETVAPTEFGRLKKLYAKQKKTWTALGKAAVKLRDLDLKLSAGLYKTQDVDHGSMWFIGGWCAM